MKSVGPVLKRYKPEALITVQVMWQARKPPM